LIELFNSNRIIPLALSSLHTIHPEEVTLNTVDKKQHEELTERQQYALMLIGLLAFIIIAGSINETYLPDVAPTLITVEAQELEYSPYERR